MFSDPPIHLNVSAKATPVRVCWLECFCVLLNIRQLKHLLMAAIWIQTWSVRFPQSAPKFSLKDLLVNYWRTCVRDLETSYVVLWAKPTPDFWSGCCLEWVKSAGCSSWPTTLIYVRCQGTLDLFNFLARINQPVAQTSSSCSSKSAVLSCQDVFVGVLKQVAMGKAIRQEAMLPTCSPSLLCASGIFSDWMAGQGVFTQWLTQTQLFSSERRGWGN